jgi:FMN phosphatase YigB (HAD superfamily)
MMKDKVILTDCDGVILDWKYSFDQWMNRHGYSAIGERQEDYSMAKRYGLDEKEAKRFCRMFNESATIRKLPPLRDAIKYIKKLHEEQGYVFHAITSLSDDQYAQHLRTKNLIELFGPTVFEKYVYLDTGADKDEELYKYKDTGCFWVEDKIANAEVGLEMGLRPLLMVHDHNRDYQGDVERVYSWREIYEKVLDWE